ncbi:protein kintoun [Halichoeres trimaculatus]|uniref:protein kintoun n=1 Tax=Halichoeres trimaculatus TaxID=147232 RepID=UPI003D9F1F0C
MEIGNKLEELNLTEDEIKRMKKAFKDEKFREMLRDYAEELSDPENKKKYEEEIALLEQERGNTVEFIHPVPFRAIKTSVNGKQKCFINICSSEKVSKPEFQWGVSEDGHRGQCWSLPHSLHPGKENTDTKGKKVIIYDVVFHPDTLHIARKDKRFMDMVESTAIEGIQKTFKVTLDKNNVRELSTKYKGTPQPCVIRKPIPGFKMEESSEKPDPLAFPYPAEKTTSTSKPTGSQTKNAEKTKNFQIEPQKTKEPTKPNYTVKYRSFIDLQDFRCSRDSAQSPRPKEIVVTIDVPLLKAVTDASLEVTEKNLLLLSKKPSYRLDLPLAYPVDEDKGEAKFNKQRGQLTVTLPVLPSHEASDFILGLQKSSVRDEELEERKSLVEEESEWKEEEREIQRSEEGEIVKEESDTKGEKGDEKMGADEENLQQIKQEKASSADEYDEGAETENSEGDTVNRCMDISPEEKKSSVTSPETEKKPVLVTAEEDVTLETTPKVNAPDIKEERETAGEMPYRNLKVKIDATPLQHNPSEEPQTTAVVSSMAETGEAHKSSEDDSSQGMSFSSEELSTGSVEQVEEEVLDEDDLVKKGFMQNQETKDSKAPSVLLREIDEDGNEKIISDHSTSAGLTFKNSLMFELD